jgi:ABC-type polysaccharide/polyol phosphate export permease
MNLISNLKEIYKHRALVWALVVRQLSSRYRGSVLGFLWTLLNPLCLMLVYTLVFSLYMRAPGVEHYSIFLFCGLLPWIWLTSALNEGTSAIVSSGHLITKSMFPPQILPLVSVLTTLLNFVLSLPILLTLMVVEGVAFHSSLLLLPVLLIIQLLITIGGVLALSALNVRYRDVQHLVSNLLTFLFFLCPIVYPVSVVPAEFRLTLDLNPIAGLMMAYQGVILDGIFPSIEIMLYLGAFAFLSLIIGNIIFNRSRENFAELL